MRTFKKTWTLGYVLLHILLPSPTTMLRSLGFAVIFMTNSYLLGAYILLSGMEFGLSSKCWHGSPTGMREEQMWPLCYLFAHIGQAKFSGNYKEDSRLIWLSNGECMLELKPLTPRVILLPRFDIEEYLVFLLVYFSIIIC